MSLTSLWQAETTLPEFSALTRDIETDAVVVGAGITGVTAALLLQRAGKRVVLIEARRVGAGETGHTTAHLSGLIDARYHAIESKFGREGARQAAESVRAALDQIETLVAVLGIRCDFERVPEYLYAETEAQNKLLEKELESLQHVGSPASWVDHLPLPLPIAGAVRLERQARFQPLEYLRALLEHFVSDGGMVFERTPMLEVDDSAPCRVSTGKAVISARDVLVLCHVPVATKLALHTKIAAYRTYAISAPLRTEFPAALFSDMQEPYHYVRAAHTAAGNALIIGGEDHKTGQNDDPEGCFQRLARYAADRFDLHEVSHRWSGQIIEPADGLPLIGKAGGEHVYVATGFSGNGMTFGTLAAMMLSDAVLERESPWAELYDPTRVKPVAQARQFITENVDFPTYLARDRFARGDSEAIDRVPRDQGRLVRSDGKMLAVYRDAAGAVHARSAVCTHLGCHVRWNGAERSWDCPCHGSRFDVDGAVLNGPATQELAPAEAATTSTSATAARDERQHR